MDEILKYIYPAAIEAARQQQQQQQQPTNENPTIDDVAGGGTTHNDHQDQHELHPSSDEGFLAYSSGGDEGTLEDFLVIAGAVPAPHQYPSSDASHSQQVAMGKQKAVEETLELDKASIQKEEKRTKIRESVARHRKRKKAYTTEIENLVKSLKIKKKQLLEEQAEKEKQRYKLLKESLIIVTEQGRPKKKLQRTNSV